ncbi:MAG: hypothetical protein COV79_01480 [Parcubacteria group bacterium CG11_big_fil_rev_8_21_14_0_20_41_14]|uniref:Uncharacterized protein n=2 Tax=Candidatus Beckwithiibacteriota TaxID=1752726 RepID=A0A2M7W7N0_9BACT|nr:MAG: hypothetical protein COV79_01480 [Parcubacteria group bacterium CG11_big_fil_rev_8_21_14_0_20_41_14]PJA23409.1 MAG: hypothetical protein COX59_00065 [Candidatus Beckwithbacteria bacterium CG_4_10_14_0_2_um_filter_47_25]
MQLLNQTITQSELNKIAQSRFGNLVKAVVDLEKKIMVVDAEMHADEEQLLLQQGSNQSSLWGINLYPDKFGTSEFVEFDSMINLRPGQNNLTRGVADEKIRNQILAVVDQWIKP